MGVESPAQIQNSHMPSASHFSPSPLMPETFPFSDLQLVVSGNGISEPPPPPRLAVSINGGDTDEVIVEEKEHKRRSKNWTRLETLTLIRTRTELNPKFRRGGGRKSDLWDKVSECLHRVNISRDAQQCRDKWEKLMAAYKDVRGGFKDRQDNPYFEELQPIMREREKQRESCWNKGQELQEPEEEEENDYGEYQNGEENGDGDGYGDDDDEEEFNFPCSSSSSCKRRKRKHGFLSAIDLGSLKYLLETVIAHQHRFFRDLLETMERNLQAREKVRLEKEEKWRAEERAHRDVLNNAMLLLTETILRDRNMTMNTTTTTTTTTTGSPFSTPVEPVVQEQSPAVLAPKKRSKNWKRGEVLQLIQLRGEMDFRFSNSTRRSLLWDELAEALETLGVKRDGKQCREKWDKLVSSHKDVIDGKRDEGDFSYFSELKNILRARPPDDGMAGCCSVEFEDHYGDNISNH